MHLPRGPERELVRDRDREYSLRGSESRTLATVGAFRVVSSRDLQDHDGRSADPRSGDLWHLREQGLIEARRVPGYRDHAVTLTKAGRSLLESHRARDHEPHHQTFHAGLVRERELEHDLQVYRAYEQAEARLLERGAHIERVALDHELTRVVQLILGHSDLKTTQRYLNITDEELRKALTGVWERRRQLHSVRLKPDPTHDTRLKPDPAYDESAESHAIGE